MRSRPTWKFFTESESLIKLSITGTGCCNTVMYFKSSASLAMFSFFLWSLYTYIMFLSWNAFNFLSVSWILLVFLLTSLLLSLMLSILLNALWKKVLFWEIAISSYSFTISKYFSNFSLWARMSAELYSLTRSVSILKSWSKNSFGTMMGSD